MGIDNLKDGIFNLVEEHPVSTALGTAGVVGGVVLGSVAIARKVKRGKSKRNKNRNSRKRGRRIKHTKRGWSQDRKRFNKRQKWEVSYRRRKKSRSKRGIKYTKNGQPYKIMSNGRARFIKRRSR